VKLPESSDAEGVLRIASRRWIAATGTPLAGYQAVAAIQSPPPAIEPDGAQGGGGGGPAPVDASVVFFHPGYQCMAVLDLARDQLVPLEFASFAAVPEAAPGLDMRYLQSTGDGLISAAARKQAPASGRSRPIRYPAIVAGPVVARRTTRPGQVILVGPGPDHGSFSCQISVVGLGRPE
jgi:hypothetical protein